MSLTRSGHRPDRTLVYPVQNLVNAVTIGFAIGVNAVIAFFLGAGQHRTAGRAAALGILLNALHGAVLTAVCLLAMPAFLAAFTDSAAILDMGLRYANIVLLFSVPIGLAMVFEKITQAMGRMVTSMVCMLIGCVANIILDPLMIFGIGPFPAMGIEAHCPMAAYLVCWKLQGLPMPLRLAGGAPGAGRLCARMYTVGVPAALNLALASLLVTELNANLAAFSQTYVQILAVYYKLQTF